MDLMTLKTMHLIATSAMVGVIWIVQLVHYPAFLFIDRVKFTDFESFHTFQISLIVAPFMLIEAITASLILLKEMSSLNLANVISIILIWLFTFFVSVPCHRKLIRSYDTDVIKSLIRTNWVRTILWSMRLIALFAYAT